MEENIKDCSLCVHGTVLSCSDDIICSKKGVLKENKPCRRYREDLTKKIVRKRRVAKSL